ncbi:MAG TPA: gliding motility-associated ABC transporter permease subunit GldF [Saprospiraceae bacterium]|nr:gliding motility-associated ABC transporter permease subunit GldF [Saprospiraceae bacterium]
MWSIYRKEISNFFSSLIGYLVIGGFLMLLGLMLWVFPDNSILETKFANLDPLFNVAPLVLMFLIPAITMRSFAEENQTGTIELLVTKPVFDWQIILAKFLANQTLVIFAIIPTLVYYITVYLLGSPKGNLDSGAIAGSYLGLMFLGACFVSIGIFASSLTKNQIVAFIVATFLCFFFHWGFSYASRMDVFIGKFDSLIQSFGVEFHYDSISRGLVDSRDVLYFLSLTGFFMFLTLLMLERRKW